MIKEQLNKGLMALYKRPVLGIIVLTIVLWFYLDNVVIALIVAVFALFLFSMTVNLVLLKKKPLPPVVQDQTQPRQETLEKDL